MVNNNIRVIQDNLTSINLLVYINDFLASEYKKISAKFTNIAKLIDIRYHFRLFISKSTINEADYNDQLNKFKRKFSILKDLRLIDDDNFDLPTNYNKDNAKRLKLYFDDLSEKYQVFDNLVNKLSIFLKIINKNLLFKKINISKDKKIEIISNKLYNTSVPLNKLSAGEKQLILLWFELIFKIDDQLLVLIDEAETSLHISWQHDFINDLIEVSNANNKKLNAIIATHSPQIINNHFDLQVDLQEILSE